MKPCLQPSVRILQRQRLAFPVAVGGDAHDGGDRRRDVDDVGIAQVLGGEGRMIE